MNATMEKIDLFIGGKFLPSCLGTYFDNVNPDDDSVWRLVAEANVDDVNRAVLSAHETWKKGYKDSTARDRETWLSNAADIIERDKELIADELCQETGSPIARALFEVQSAIDYMRSSSSMARSINEHTQQTTFTGKVVMSVRESMGVCASISSSSEPFLKAVKLSAGPLMVGNTVVSLASDLTPNAPMNLAKIYQEAGFPDGAYNQLAGFGKDVGDFLTMHPMVKVVLFSGSGHIGKHISEICGLQMKRCILELGSKRSAFITSDADLEHAANSISLFTNRIMCEESVYERFLKLFTQRVEQIRDKQMGDLRTPDTSLGPVLSLGIRESLNAHISDAERKGATMLTGGQWVGNRCQPTILTNVTPEMTVCRSETFGPVMTVYKVKDFDEGLSLANDIDFSLSSSIWTANINKAMEYTHRVECATTYINSDPLLNPADGNCGELIDTDKNAESAIQNIEKLTDLKLVTIQLPGDFELRSAMAAGA